MRHAALVLVPLLVGIVVSTGGVEAHHALAQEAPADPTDAIVSSPALDGPADVSSDDPTDAQCPRPSDQDGPLYYEVTGIFTGIHTDPGGGQFVALKRSDASPEELLSATEDLVTQLQSVPAGTRMTLVSYRVSSRAGSGGGSPPFSCVEPAP